MDYPETSGYLPETSAEVSGRFPSGVRRFPAGFCIIHHWRSTQYMYLKWLQKWVNIFLMHVLCEKQISRSFGLIQQQQIVTWKLFRHQKNKQLSEYKSSKFNQDSFWNEISQFWFSVQADDDGGGGGGDGSSIIIELQAMMTMGLTHIALHCRDQ